MSHTPGEWYAKDLNIYADMPNGHVKFVAFACVVLDKTEEHEANARLLAAAPTLLSVVKGIFDATELPGSDEHVSRICNLVMAARAAIVLVEGSAANAPIQPCETSLGEST